MWRRTLPLVLQSLTGRSVGFLRLLLTRLSVEFRDDLLQEQFLPFGRRTKDLFDDIAHLMDEATLLPVAAIPPEHVVQHLCRSTFLRI